jgi:nucleoside-diphosphate-sugar epimerase
MTPVAILLAGVSLPLRAQIQGAGQRRKDRVRAWPRSVRRIATMISIPSCGHAADAFFWSPETVCSATTRQVTRQRCLRNSSPVSVVRNPPSVHGDGDHAFVPALIRIAREKKVSAYVGDGSNRWSAVHRLDAAHLYRLALEKGVAGATFHSVAEEGVPTRDIADVIGRCLKVPAVSKSREEANDHFGWLARFYANDNPASSTRTQQQLGWRPRQPGRIADLEGGRYSEI